jgi:hypothetical protein
VDTLSERYNHRLAVAEAILRNGYLKPVDLKPTDHCIYSTHNMMSESRNYPDRVEATQVASLASLVVNEAKYFKGTSSRAAYTREHLEHGLTT